VLRAVADAGEEGAPSRGTLPLARRSLIEGVGTALLLAIIVGSGIMAERIAGGNGAMTLLANSTATGAGLVALILALGRISGAHLNPVVTIADVVNRGRPAGELAGYIGAQVLGAVVGVGAAELMFGERLFALSSKPRPGLSQIFGETVATFGLLLVASLSSRRSVEAAAVAVGCYIAAAYWFTSSTSFANPAVTLARSLTNTFTGIRLADAPGFLAGQLAGMLAFVLFARGIEPTREP